MASTPDHHYPRRRYRRRSSIMMTMTTRNHINPAAAVVVVVVGVLLLLSNYELLVEALQQPPCSATLRRLPPLVPTQQIIKRTTSHHHTRSQHYLFSTFQTVTSSSSSSGTNMELSSTIGASTTTTSSTPTIVSSSSSSISGSNILSDTSKRGNVNEIDYCIAPADVSLSRAYGTADGSVVPAKATTTVGAMNDVDTSSMSDNKNRNTIVGLSLTRALNNASNRAVRRIILAPSWPTPIAFNRSLRQVAAMELAAQLERRQQQQQLENDASATSATSTTDAKCPLPRPILNVLTGKSKTESNPNDGTIDNTSSTTTITTQSTGTTPSSEQPTKGRTDAEYVMDQIASFRTTYGTVPGYNNAEDYLQCVLALATTGFESSYVTNVMSAGIYNVAYQRMLSVLQTVGVEFVTTTTTTDTENENDTVDGRPPQRRRISNSLNDQDICLSVLDTLQMKHGKVVIPISNVPQGVVGTSNGDTNNVEASKIDAVMDTSNLSTTTTTTTSTPKKKWSIWNFWPRMIVTSNNDENNDRTESRSNDGSDSIVQHPTDTNTKNTGILLSVAEPTMTRQLNVLSNIVLRVLLFGGDQELLVVSETLHSDLPAFIDRWYPPRSTTVTTATTAISSTTTTTRPGVDYINCMIQLLRNCYNDGVVTDLDPPISLPTSYANSYERLVANAVELGSGYLKPIPFVLQQSASTAASSSAAVASGTTSIGATSTNTIESNIGLVASIPIPRTAQEELGRFAILESNFRQAQQLSSPSSPALYTPYPMDLVGQWEVRDEISGEIIGNSVVTFLENGNVQVPPPLEGLRWRLDPGPTHLDTCTFQVLSTIDRTILQYRGFIDRGARLEARFSKRPLRIRGSVMFQMRDGSGGSIDYYKDMLPINYRTGTTKFVMRKLTK